jgi:hypothetical protein
MSAAAANAVRTAANVCKRWPHKSPALTVGLYDVIIRFPIIPQELVVSLTENRDMKHLTRPSLNHNRKQWIIPQLLPSPISMNNQWEPGQQMKSATPCLNQS